MKCYKVLKDLPVSVEFKIGYIYGEPAFMYLDLEMLIKNGYVMEVKETEEIGQILKKFVTGWFDGQIREQIMIWNKKQKIELLKDIMERPVELTEKSQNIFDMLRDRINNKISELEKEIL